MWNRKSIKIYLRVTRTLFAFAEMTNMDPGYAGPEFDFDQIIKELMIKVKQSLVVHSFYSYSINALHLAKFLSIFSSTDTHNPPFQILYWHAVLIKIHSPLLQTISNMHTSHLEIFQQIIFV